MFARFHSSAPSHATVVAYLALFVALGGSGYAAVTINGKNVKRSTITGRAIKDGSVTGRDVGNGTLRGSDLRRNSIGGREVNELALSKVLSAGSADRAATAESAARASTAASADRAGDAATVGGVTVRPFSFNVPGTSTAGPQEVLDLGGLKLTASCPSSQTTVVTASTTLPGDNLLNSVSVQTTPTVLDTDNRVAVSPFNGSTTIVGVPADHDDDQDQIGTTIFRGTNGKTVVAHWLVTQNGPNVSCSFNGYATAG